MNNTIIKAEDSPKEEKWLSRTLRNLEDIFYIITEKEVRVITDKTSEGYKHDIKYNGELEVPGLMDMVATMQTQAELRLKNNGSNHNECVGSFKKYEFDPFGIKRLNKYLSK